MEEEKKPKRSKKHKPKYEELLAMLDEMNKNFDRLPPHVQFQFVTNIDMNSALLLIAELFRAQLR